MNKETFFTMSHDKRVEEVNKLLQSMGLKEAADKIGVNYSTFTKEMQTGDYVFIQRDNRYYKFLRDPISKTLSTMQTGYADELNFLRGNLDMLKKLIANDKSPLVLDQRIYAKNSQFTVKSIKMNDDIYSIFTQYCDENYPHFRIQDLIAQSLLNFIEKY